MNLSIRCGTQYSLLPVFLRYLVCFRLSITFGFGLAEDAAAAADLALAAAVADPAERTPSSCQQPPANHVKQAEGDKRGGGGEEDDRDGDGHHPGLLFSVVRLIFLTPETFRLTFRPT